MNPEGSAINTLKQLNPQLKQLFANIQRILPREQAAAEEQVENAPAEEAPEVVNAPAEEAPGVKTKTPPKTVPRNTNPRSVSVLSVKNE